MHIVLFMNREVLCILFITGIFINYISVKIAFRIEFVYTHCFVLQDITFISLNRGPTGAYGHPF